MAGPITAAKIIKNAITFLFNQAHSLPAGSQYIPFSGNEIKFSRPAFARESKTVADEKIRNQRGHGSNQEAGPGTQHKARNDTRNMVGCRQSTIPVATRPTADRAARTAIVAAFLS